MGVQQVLIPPIKQIVNLTKPSTAVLSFALSRNSISTTIQNPSTIVHNFAQTQNSISTTIQKKSSIIGLLLQ